MDEVTNQPMTDTTMNWAIPRGIGQHAMYGYEPTPARERSRFFAVVDDEHLVHPNDITRTPRRADDGSAGYDFYSKETVSLDAGQIHVFWTDVKAYMRRSDEVLKIFIRSSLASNRDLVLINAVGIIDRSYFGNEKNDGNIGIGIRNVGSETQHITEGERIAQGIFEVFMIVDNDEARIEEEHGVGRVRNGGMGSTGTSHLDGTDAVARYTTGTAIQALYGAAANALRGYQANVINDRTTTAPTLRTTFDEQF